MTAWRDAASGLVMAIGRKTPHTPFTRWQGRFHRDELGKDSEVIAYATRRSFDGLRVVTEEDREWNIATGIMHAIDITSEENRWACYYFEDDGRKHIVAASRTSDLTGDAGILAKWIERDAVVGEFESSKECPVIALHYIDSLSDLGESEIQFDSLEEALSSESIFDWGDGGAPNQLPDPVAGIPPLPEGVLIAGDFELEMLKLLPTDLFRKDSINGTTDGREEAIELIKCQLAEVRVANTEGAPSLRQSKVMELLELGLSPAINLTGRPGTGKTTVAQMAVPELFLQRGVRRGKRRILYVTTTNDLAVEARKEIEKIAEHVYPLGRDLTERLMGHVEILTRHQLIQDLALDSARFDSSILGEMIDNALANEKQILESKKSRQDRNEWGLLKRTWLEGQESLHDLSRVLENLVFGLFGSTATYLDWYESCTGEEGREDPKKWRDIFNENKVNLFEPAESYQEEVRSNPSEDSDEHVFTLSDFWNPFTEKDISKGRDKIASLGTFLREPSLGGKLFQEGEGHWTYGSVIDRIDQMIENGEINKPMRDGTTRNPSAIWRRGDEKARPRIRGNLNAFDAIVIDESQDFTVREISVILKWFSIRAAETDSTTSSSAGRLPFLFLASGDPLQTIEGSLFNSRNGHINALYDDWRAYLRRNSFDPHHPSDNGLMNIIHEDLEANHRNSGPIVQNVINPTIGEMRVIAKEELGQKRELKTQTVASSRRGFVLTSGGQDKVLKQIWEMTVQQIVAQVEKAKQQSLATPPRATVALILAGVDGEDDDKLLSAIPKDGSFLPLREAVRSLLDLGLEGDWKKKVLRDAGIHDIVSVKGLTLEAAVVVGFGDRLHDSVDNGPYERMRLHSHYLVASSRPQFALLLHDSEHAEWVDDSTDSMESEDLKKILERVEINLEPALALDRAMETPGDQRFWDILKSAIEQIRGKQRQKDKSEIWRAAEEFVNWANRIHELYEMGKYRRAAELVGGVADDQELGEKLRKGAAHIGRPALIDSPGEGEKTPTETLHSFLSWRDFTENCGQGHYDTAKKKSVQWVSPIMEPWVILGGTNNGADSEACSNIFENLQEFRFTPFEGGGEQYKAPKREDCTVGVTVPPGWMFSDMVQANAWSTHYSQLIQIVEAAGKRTKPGDKKNILRLKWYIYAAREPRKLWGLIDSPECKTTDRREQIADWLLNCLAGDSPGPRFVEAFEHWMYDSKKRGVLHRMFRDWLQNDFGTERILLVKEALQEDRFAEFIKSDGKWLEQQIVECTLSEFAQLGGGSDVLVWAQNRLLPTLTVINKYVAGEIRAGVLSRRISGLFEAMERDMSGAPESRTVRRKRGRRGGPRTARLPSEVTAPPRERRALRLRQWLLDDNLDQIASRTGWKVGNTSTIALALISIIRRSTGYSSIRDDIYQEWFGKSLSRTWNDGWKNRDVEKTVDILKKISTGRYGLDGKSGEIKLFNDALRESTGRRMDGFLQEVYEDSVTSGGASNLLWHPALEYLMYLHAADKRERKDPRLILRATKEALNASENAPDLSMYYREGHNFWNLSTFGDNDTARVRSRYAKKRKIVRGLMRTRGMWRENVWPMGQGPVPREARVPWPSTDLGGKPHQFSNTSPGIIAYSDVASGLSISKMKDIHWRFRLSGSYREAAVLSVCLAIHNSKNAAKGADSTKISEAVSLGLHDAILERCGAYMDHVQVNRRWAAKASPDKHEVRGRGQRAPLMSMMTLRLDRGDSKIKPTEPSPIGRKSALRLLEDSTLEQILLHLEPKAGTESTLSKRDLKQALLRPADIIESTRRLLPYILLAEEVKLNDNKWLVGAQWFSPKDTGAMVDDTELASPIEHRFGVKEYREDTLIDYSRDDLVAMLADEGDSWMLELCDLHRSVGEWDSSSLKEFTDRFFLLLEKAPGSLDRMARTLLRENDDSEDDSESEFDALLGGLDEEQQRALRAWKKRQSGT